ncbi:hypothetical protein ACFUMH_00655, partial [Cellulomonas sp. NPDC057328]
MAATKAPRTTPSPTVEAAGTAPAAPLRITVLGTGYLGATHAVAMAELGFDVTGVDTDQSKVDAL